MSVNLQKGQRVNLRKSDGKALRNVTVGLGWDEAQAKGGFFAPKPQAIDCDASALICTNGHLVKTEDIVYFGNLTHSCGCVRHMGDNLTGEGEGDDEVIMVDLANLPAQYDKVIFVVNIYKANERGQHFGMIKNAFIRIVDAETNQELCKYDLSENYSDMTAMVFGELYRYNDEWKFNAIGQPTHDNSLSTLAKRFL